MTDEPKIRPHPVPAAPAHKESAAAALRSARILTRLVQIVALALGLVTVAQAAQAGSASAQPTATRSYRADLGSASPSLDIYAPADLSNAPVMVYVHGGAWVAGNKRAVHAKPAHFNGLGMVFVSVDYRLVPTVRVEDQLQDIDRALGWIASNIGRFGGNSREIWLMGHSAGAHLVTQATLAPGPQTRALIDAGALRGVIANDTRAYDIPRIAKSAPGGTLPKLYARVFGPDPGRWTSLSPIYRITPGQTIPDFLVLHSGQGNAAQRAGFARDFAAALARNGVRVTLFDGRKYSHRQINTGIGTARDITSAIDGFLARPR